MTVIEWYYRCRKSQHINLYSQRTQKAQKNDQYTKIKCQCDIISNDMLFVQRNIGNECVCV